MAAALAVLDVLEQERLQENARFVGSYLLGALGELSTKHTMIGDVRGAGLANRRDPRRCPVHRRESVLS
jgi:4-aminobutyrate aminotransferase-like enzyme